MSFRYGIYTISSLEKKKAKAKSNVHSYLNKERSELH